MKKFYLLSYTSVKSIRVLSFALLIILCSFYFIPGANAQKSGVFYSVSGNGLKDTSYLFGTYHLIKSSWLDDKIKVQHAFKKSKGIVVEVVMDSSELAAANAKGLLKGKQLKDLLSNEFSDSLDVELKKILGVGIDQFNPVKPMTVMLAMSMVQLMKDNQELMQKYTGSALDASFAEQAKIAGKAITPLETINEQMDYLFNNLSDEKQAEYLKLFIRNVEEGRRLGNELLQAYFANDLITMYAIYQQASATNGDMDYLIKDRNYKWLKILPSLMKKQSQFIAAGALHLSGPDGLVEQLKQMGYTVTALNL